MAIVRGTGEIEEEVWAGHRADIDAAELVEGQIIGAASEKMLPSGTIKLAETIHSVASVKPIAREAALVTQCAWKALREARAEGAKRHRGCAGAGEMSSYSALAPAIPAPRLQLAPAAPVERLPLAPAAAAEILPPHPDRSS